MRLIDILGIVSSVAYKDVDEKHLACIASQISVYKDEDRLFFNKANLTSPITQELLNTDLKVSSYIVFEGENNIWSAFELYSAAKVYDFCENTKEKQSNRLILQGLDRFVVSSNINNLGNMVVENFKGTKIVKVLP